MFTAIAFIVESSNLPLNVSSVTVESVLPIQNLERYEQKEKTKQQESQILGQKPGNWTSDQRKEVNERR